MDGCCWRCECLHVLLLLVPVPVLVAVVVLRLVLLLLLLVVLSCLVQLVQPLPCLFSVAVNVCM